MVALVVVQVALLGNIVYAPYDYGVQDRMETYSLVASFVTLVGGIFFNMQHQDATSDGSGMFLSQLSVEVLVAAANVGVLVLALKVVANGFLLHQGAYLRSLWNWLDFTVVLTAWLSIVVTAMAGGDGVLSFTLDATPVKLQYGKHFFLGAAEAAKAGVVSLS